MSRRGILLGLAACCLAVGIAAGRANAAKLDTQSILGTWVGQWNDTTLNMGGAFILEWAPLGTKGSVLVTWHLGGNFFGCGEVGPVSGALQPRGGNSFTKHAIHVNSRDEVFGRIHVKSKGTKFFIRGKNTCSGAGPKKYSATGTLVGSDFTAQMTTKVDGGTDTLTFTLHKFL